MKRYRIVSNAEHVYRVQRRVKLGFARIWVFEKFYEVNESYPKVVSHPVEFKNTEEAERYIEKRLKEELEKKRWRVVKSYSDNKPVA